jgi:membrane protein
MQGAESVTARAVWVLIKETASKWNDISAPRLAAALAYYTMLSIAPLLVLSIAIAGLVFGPQAAEGRIISELEGIVGYHCGAAIQELLAHARHLSSGVTPLLVSTLLFGYGASRVFAELRDSLNLVWGLKTTGPGVMGIIRNRLASFVIVIGVGFLLLVSLLFSTAIAAAGELFGGMLPLPEVVLDAVNVAVSFVTLTTLFALLYKVIPEVRIEWRDVWIGAAVTSALFSLGKLLIGLYLGKAGVESAYGAAGSMVAFLIWVYYSAQIFFLGAEFTCAFSERHGSRAGLPTLRREEPARVPSPSQQNVALRRE